MRLLIFIFATMSLICSDIEVHKLLENEHYDPVHRTTVDFANHSKRNYVDMTSEGNLGIVYRSVEDVGDRGKKKITVFYHDLQSHELEVITSFTTYRVPQMNLLLVYDNLDLPHIVLNYKYKFIHYSRRKDTWKERKLPISLRRMLGGAVQKSRMYHIVVGKNNNLYLLLLAMVNLKQRILLAEYSQKRWQIKEIPNVPQKLRKIFFVEIYDLQNFSILYKKLDNLCYAEVENNAWQEETVIKAGNLEEAGWEASLVHNEGKVYIASTFRRVVSSGSLVFSKLLWSYRAKGKWKTETIADQSQGYSGSDGRKYTGASPHSFFDEKGRAHIIFNDISSWHSKGFNDFTEGNLRHSYQKGSTWKNEILYPQVGQWHKKQPLYEFLYPVAIYTRGKLHCFGIERVTNGKTTRFSGEKPMTFSIVHIVVD
ncbi:hypothetical protein [Candidatus Uabimicrobium sp. HlEnr_7]|uniref:hypothetical protein n=1 Tax=Candidatus Uabimicrobium helgolandensis TaxID=3095367 RepID=UPI0035580872